MPSALAARPRRRETDPLFRKSGDDRKKLHPPRQKAHPKHYPDGRELVPSACRPRQAPSRLVRPSSKKLAIQPKMLRHRRRRSAAPTAGVGPQGGRKAALAREILRCRGQNWAAFRGRGSAHRLSSPVNDVDHCGKRCLSFRVAGCCVHQNSFGS